MKRTPCKPGTIIGWYDLRATVVEDDGGKTLRVKCDSENVETWEWDYYMTSLRCVKSCFVISRPRSRNNRLSTVFRRAALYYLRAAEREEHMLDYLTHSCPSIYWSAKEMKLSKSKAKELYAEYFKPKNVDTNSPWFDAMTAENQERRCLSLLFMAEIAKDL